MRKQIDNWHQREHSLPMKVQKAQNAEDGISGIRTILQIKNVHQLYIPFENSAPEINYTILAFQHQD